jgi:hypothetical protein
MSQAVHKELRVKRYDIVPQETYDGEGTCVTADSTMEEVADGPYVLAADVKASLRAMLRAHRLTPETTTRIITQLAL